MLENSLEQIYSSALEMYTSAKPINLSNGSMSSPIGGSRPMRCHSGTFLGDSLPNAFSTKEKKSSKISLTNNKAYFKLNLDENLNIGITHHEIGLGKLKIFDKEEKKEYGIPINDILKKVLKYWNVDKK